VHFAQRADYAAQDIEIRVGYSSHPFTRQCAEGEHPHAAYSKPHDPRVFCPDRYQLSLRLPAIIAGIETRRCYATNFKNYFVVDTFDILPPNTEYWVFFNTRKADQGAMRLFIESAYAGDCGKAPHGRRRQADMFRALVSKTLGLKKANPAG
jgi:hypothetical protein